MEVLLILLLFIPLCKFLFRAVCAVLGFIGSIIGGILQAIGGGMERKEAERRADRIATERAAREQRKIEDQARRIEAARLKDIERRERDLQREAREKERHEWMKERQEWARQKEQDRRQELEWKRKQREQIEKERKEQQQQSKADFKLQEAREDLQRMDYSIGELLPAVEEARTAYREAVKRSAIISNVKKIDGVLNGEYDDTPTETEKDKKKRMQLYNRMVQLENRLSRLDKQRARAIYTLQGGA